MLDNENHFVIFLKKDIPSLVVVHCLVHCEALALCTFKTIFELLFVEKLTKKIYSCVKNFTKKNNHPKCSENQSKFWINLKFKNKPQKNLPEK
jgi:hypothetical protein